MNWYNNIKISAKIETFEDRNSLNNRIRTLKKMTQILSYLKDYVYQNAPHAKKIILNFAEDKIISSFPSIKKLLMDAYERALDNYKNFGEICEITINTLYKKIKELEKDRSDFSNKYQVSKLKEKFKNE